MRKLILAAFVVACSSALQAQVLYNNAVARGLTAEGLRTSARNGGGSYSEVQQGNMICGFRSSVTNGANDRLADDFTVTNVGGWNVTDVSFYMYQTDAPGIVTIKGGVFEIHQKLLGGLMGAVVATGTFTGATVLDIYRIYNKMYEDARRLQKVTVSFNAHLDPGSYYLVWSALGTLPYSGPWTPYLTKAGSRTVPSANGLQSTNGGLTWFNVQDGLLNQDFPFTIQGSTAMGSNGS